MKAKKEALLILVFCAAFYALNASNPNNPETNSVAGEKLDMMSDEAFLDWKKTALPMDVGLAILNHSEQSIISDLMADEAGSLLSSQDLFVQAAAEWALSLRVGNENKNDLVIWPKSKNPEWFEKWIDISLEKRIEMDWCRQAISAGMSNSPEKLVAQIEEMGRRIQLQIRNDCFRQEDLTRINHVYEKLEELIWEINQDDQSGRDIVRVREYWLEAKRLSRPVVFANREIDFESLVFYTRFAAHHKPNVCGNIHNGVFKPGGDITIIKGLEELVHLETLIGDQLPDGHIHGMDLHFDGSKLVFAYGKQEIWPPTRESHYNPNSSWGLELRQSLEPVSLYEMETDGTGITQLTSHPVWSDTEPVYCPNDDIAFSSERSSHSPSCDHEFNDIADANLFLLKRNSNSIRRLANHRDADMTPRLLDNGLLAYLRWEYQERLFTEVHSIWTVRPDGTNPDALYKQHIPSPWALREVRSVPNSNKLVAIAAGHHCYARGPIILIDPSVGGNDPAGMENMTPGVIPQEGEVNEITRPVRYGGVKESRGFYRNPYPLSEDLMLASYSYASPYCNPYKNEIQGYDSQVEANGFGIYLIDSYGNKELIYRDPIYCSVDVMPLRKRKRPVVLPDLVSEEKNYATCVITNVYEGMAEDIEPGSIKYIRISQHLPTPLDDNGRARKFAFGPKFSDKLPAVTRWTSVREIGLVPVEEDGSAHFKVPTAQKASVYFQALDEKHMELVRMRSSVSFQPGEQRSCTGCHETQTYRAPSQAQGLAYKKPALMPRKAPWGYTPFDYETMVQPVLDKNCISCHSGHNEMTGLDLTSKKISAKGSPEKYNQSYKSILGPALLGTDEESLVVLNDRNGDGSITQPKQFGSHKSKFITTLLKGHHGVTLSKDEWYALVTWVDYNAPYHGKLVNRYPKDGSMARREAYKWPDPWGKDTVLTAFTDYKVPTRIHEESALIVGDPESEKIYRYDLAGKIKWTYESDSCSDLHMLPNGNLLLADGSMVKEVDRRGIAILKFRNSGEISSCVPLQNGFTLAVDSKNDRLLMLDRRMKFHKELPLQIEHKGQNTIRKVRVGPKGSYFVAQGKDRIVGEYNKEGVLLRRISFNDEVFSVLPMDNGNVIVGGRGGVQIIDTSDNIVWSLMSDDLPEAKLQTISDMVLLPNGNLLLCNGSKLFEVNKSREVVQSIGNLESSGSPSCIEFSGISQNWRIKIDLANN